MATFVLDSRPHGLDYGVYKSLAAMKGLDAIDETMFKALPVEGEDDDDEDADADDDDDDGEPDDADDDSAKSLDGNDDEPVVDSADLLKALDDYDNVEAAVTEAGTSRETYLKARLDAGTIDKSERAELAHLWLGTESGAVTTGGYLSKSVMEMMDEDDDAASLVNASSFLKSLVDGVDARMDEVVGEVSREGRATRELLKAQGGLVKSLAYVADRQGKLIKSLLDRVETVEGTPAAPRAVTADQRRVRTRALSKSAVDGGGSTDLTKSDVNRGLTLLMEKAHGAKDEAAMRRVEHATALWESAKQIRPQTMQAIRAVLA